MEAHGSVGGNTTLHHTALRLATALLTLYVLGAQARITHWLRAVVTGPAVLADTLFLCEAVALVLTQLGAHRCGLANAVVVRVGDVQELAIRERGIHVHCHRSGAAHLWRVVEEGGGGQVRRPLQYMSVAPQAL